MSRTWDDTVAQKTVASSLLGHRTAALWGGKNTVQIRVGSCEPMAI
jgi:hypothetical protein